MVKFRHRKAIHTKRDPGFRLDMFHYLYMGCLMAYSDMDLKLHYMSRSSVPAEGLRALSYVQPDLPVRY